MSDCSLTIRASDSNLSGRYVGDLIDVEAATQLARKNLNLLSAPKGQGAIS